MKLEKLWQVVYDGEENDGQNVDQGGPRLGELEISHLGNSIFRSDRISSVYIVSKWSNSKITNL